jgi:hypothetical protein
MADKIIKTSKTNKMYAKRLPKSQRIHARRVKQETRKGVPTPHG